MVLQYVLLCPSVLRFFCKGKGIFISFFFQFKVSETHACKMAAAMHQELGESNRIDSSEFLNRAERLHSTGHANRLPKVFREFGLQADIPVSFRNIGLTEEHPILRLRDVFTTLDKAGKIREHLLAGNGPEQLKQFWSRYKKMHPDHDVFSTHADNLSACIPMMLHLDEGTSQKKKSVMILSTQIVCGKGSKRAMGHNFLGSTYLSRYLFSVLLGRTYANKKSVLYALFEAWAEDLTDCYQTGVELANTRGFSKLWPVFLNCKGDWPALTKAGRLIRHHLRDSHTNDDGPGICHLCRAGQRNYPWNAFEADAAWLHADSPLPWSTPSPLSRIPQNPNNLAGFFAIDLFHVCHKGVVADYVASAIATLLMYFTRFSKSFP